MAIRLGVCWSCIFVISSFIHHVRRKTFFASNNLIDSSCSCARNGSSSMAHRERLQSICNCVRVCQRLQFTCYRFRVCQVEINTSIRRKNIPMKAIVYHSYGSPDVLQFEEVEKPAPRDDEVLIKVSAASVNAADWHRLRADPFLARLYNELLKPKRTILGSDVAGRVEAVGSNVKQFQPGDEVFGNLFESG